MQSEHRTDDPGGERERAHAMGMVLAAAPFMSTKKRVLLIGFDPRLQDFSGPEFASHGLTLDKVLDGIRTDRERIEAAGYELDQCLVDRGETAESVVASRLRQGTYDCVVLGGGLRTRPEYLLLFERILNLVHQGAPAARICFDAKAGESLEAVKRWI